MGTVSSSTIKCNVGADYSSSGTGYGEYNSQSTTYGRGSEGNSSVLHNKKCGTYTVNSVRIIMKCGRRQQQQCGRI